MRALLRRSALLATFALVLLIAPDAAAQRRLGDGFRLELHGTVSWERDAGGGIRFDIPIVPNGFLRRGRDQLALSVGGELFFGKLGKDPDGEAWPIVAVQWNFWPRPRWSLFPEVGGTVELEFKDKVKPRPFAAFGVRYHFSPAAAFVVRGGWPIGLQAGIAFTF